MYIESNLKAGVVLGLYLLGSWSELIYSANFCRQCIGIWSDGSGQ